MRFNVSCTLPKSYISMVCACLYVYDYVCLDGLVNEFQIIICQPNVFRCCCRCLHCMLAHRFSIVLFLSMFSLSHFCMYFMNIFPSSTCIIIVIISVVDHIFLLIVHTLVCSHCRQRHRRKNEKINKEFSHTTNKQITNDNSEDKNICITSKYARWSS